MKIPNRVMRYWRHLVLFVVLSMAVMPGVASKNSQQVSVDQTISMRQAVAADNSAPVRLASECSAIQPCDRKGNRLEVKKDAALLLGLLAGLSAHR